MLAIGFLRSGFFQYNFGTTGSVSGYGHYWANIALGNINVTGLSFSPSSFSSVTANVAKARGWSVRCVSFNNLLSGSYGLAEGTNLTNADTAVLGIGFQRSGFYTWVNGIISEQQRNARIWTMSIFSVWNAYHIFLGSTVNEPTKYYVVGFGSSVRCLFLPSSSFMEAMGWPWDTEI